MTDAEDDTLELPPVPEFGTARPRSAAQRIHPRRLGRGHLKQWARLRARTIATGHPTRGGTVTARAASLGLAALVAWRTVNEQPASSPLQPAPTPSTLGGPGAPYPSPRTN